MKLERLGPYLWEIPVDASRGMRVPARVVAGVSAAVAVAAIVALDARPCGAGLLVGAAGV